MTNWLTWVEGIAVRSDGEYRDVDGTKNALSCGPQQCSTHSLTAMSSQHNQVYGVLPDDFANPLFYVSLLKNTCERDSFYIERLLQCAHLVVTDFPHFLFEVGRNLSVGHQRSCGTLHMQGKEPRIEQTGQRYGVSLCVSRGFAEICSEEDLVESNSVDGGEVRRQCM